MERSVSKNKRRRTKKDRISDLPDPLLLHILSFLPAEEAVATSLLSKRWRPLWRSLPAIDFKTEKFRYIKSFLQFVDKMLKLVDLKSVKKFVLNVDCHKAPQKTSEWIDAVIGKVEYLELHMSSTDVYEVPSSVSLPRTLGF
ncbi:hypothetical protein QN277_024972 [Acacia crassicarpa]|uniref:F-box domain-containing protein n=1 Tax=Acacia crassicarpa TaxID=499986 RepID=A0AAE1KAC4_9FABA|nr:hypothetical protein QN277_024972 [Acacia crassicarpa]